MTIWNILGIEETSDLAAIKKAYAKNLKIHSPEKDPEGFKRLREAYDLAVNFANGLPVEPSMLDFQDNNAHLKNPQPMTEENLVDAFINVLINDENEAKAFLLELDKSGKLDNLAFSEKFQSLLAIRLLAFTPRYSILISEIIDFFDWHRKIENEEPGTYSRLALINLLNNNSAYSLRRYIHKLASVKDKKEALEKKLDWDDCMAARFFDSNTNPPSYFYTNKFTEKRRASVLKLLDAINNNPEAIGLNLNLHSINWWRKRRDTIEPIGMNILCTLGIIFVVLIIGFTYLRDEYGLPTQLESYEKSETIPANSEPEQNNIGSDILNSKKLEIQKNI